DKGDGIEGLPGPGERLQLVNHHLHVGQVAATGRRDARPLRRGLQRQQFRGRFADVTADRATTGADLQHPATQERREGTQQVGAARDEVEVRGQDMDLARQLGREYGTVLAVLDRTQQRLLVLDAVAVPPAYGRSLAHPLPARV